MLAPKIFWTLTLAWTTTTTPFTQKLFWNLDKAFANWATLTFVCSISPVTNMLKVWYTLHLKGRIHRFVWSTKTFLYNIREPRYKLNKIGYQISKVLYIGESNVLRTDTPYCFLYNWALPCCTLLGLNLMYVSWCHLWNKIFPRLQKSLKYSKILESDNPYY